MRPQHKRRGALPLVVTGCLCCVAAGCGRDSGAEFRTYEQTMADATGTGEPTATDPEADFTVVPEPLPENPQTPTVQESPETDPAAEAASDSATGAELTPDEAPPSDPPDEAETTNTLAAATPNENGFEPAPPVAADPAAESDETVRSVSPREIELLVPDRDFQREGPEGAVRVSYDDIDLLKVLNMDPVPKSAPSYFPGWLSGLAGQRIRIRGFMYPPPIETGIPAFLLARDNQICCFGRNPMPYDIVPVILRDGVTTHYINGRPFDVVGVFHISVEMNLDDPTKVKTVYYIDDAIVIDE